jgi:hypothetical protein
MKSPFYPQDLSGYGCMYYTGNITVTASDRLAGGYMIPFPDYSPVRSTDMLGKRYYGCFRERGFP